MESYVNPVCTFSDAVAKQQAAGSDLRSAVAGVRRAQRALCLEVLEIIGSWPSSEPELRELQRQWR